MLNSSTMWRSTTGVPRRCSARGADALLAARRIGGDTAAPLKAEARRRIGGWPVLRAHRLRQPGGEAEQQNGERRES